jgi:hypothetical protein
MRPRTVKVAPFTRRPPLNQGDRDARIYALILANLGVSKFGAVRNTIRAELEGIFVAQTHTVRDEGTGNQVIAAP